MASHVSLHTWQHESFSAGYSGNAFGKELPVYCFKLKPSNYHTENCQVAGGTRPLGLRYCKLRVWQKTLHPGSLERSLSHLEKYGRIRINASPSSK